MGKFNLMHCLPHPRVHVLHGYDEVIEAIAWGLAQLGHEVGYTINEFELGSTNIIFGAQVLPIDFLNKLPDDTIIYNFEQLRGISPSQIVPQLHFIAKRFQIWEYSPANLELWTSIGATTVKIVPVGYAPILSRIEKPVNQDIDVLIYGSAGEERLRAFYLLANAGISTVFVSGLYGEARDNLISRSKIILNINFYVASKIFEVVRVSYLFANKKAVVATMDQDILLPAGINSCVKFTTLQTITDDCVFLLDNAPARTNLENAGFDFFSKIDIREILSNALTITDDFVAPRLNR